MTVLSAPRVCVHESIRALSSVDEALARVDRHVAAMQDAMHVPGMAAE